LQPAGKRANTTAQAPHTIRLMMEDFILLELRRAKAAILHVSS
jgi:hypothetical protein